ncbi:MAG: hypothetical protein QOE70_4863 [Chthoniobacter sp.]|jgi:hypothetical protein|nr:hypothetical protein [Chthoniobacter sp.]
MIASRTTAELYPRILGEAWWSLAEPVRAAHALGEKRGRFRVSHGTNWLARRLARWSRLPREVGLTETVLNISADGDGQQWHRRFGADTLTTTQWRADSGFLIERFREWELSFALRVEAAALVFEQRAAWLRLGPLCVRVPLRCAPRVQAQAAADGPDRVGILVTVTLPLVGILITYEGHLEVEERTP